MAWALNPWADDPLFLPAPDDGRAAYAVSEHVPPVTWRKPSLTAAYDTSPRYATTRRHVFGHPTLGRFVVYAASGDEARLLAILYAAELAIWALTMIGRIR